MNLSLASLKDPGRGLDGSESLHLAAIYTDCCHLIRDTHGTLLVKDLGFCCWILLPTLVSGMQNSLTSFRSSPGVTTLCRAVAQCAAKEGPGMETACWLLS